MLLTTRDISPGILGCRLDLRMLYTDERDRAKFEERWASFYASDQAHSAIYSRAENDVMDSASSLAKRPSTALRKRNNDAPHRSSHPSCPKAAACWCFNATLTRPFEVLLILPMRSTWRWRENYTAPIGITPMYTPL
jgi:hypothetical protein